LPVRHPQREALEFALDGLALDCCGDARSQEGLSQAKSLQATSGLTSRACCSLRKGSKQSRSCSKRQGRLTSFPAAPAPGRRCPPKHHKTSQRLLANGYFAQTVHFRILDKASYRPVYVSSQGSVQCTAIFVFMRHLPGFPSHLHNATFFLPEGSRRSGLKAFVTTGCPTALIVARPLPRLHSGPMRLAPGRN
jgi:hypothetical protein